MGNRNHLTTSGPGNQDYGHLHATLAGANCIDSTQHEKGIKEFGDAGVHAVLRSYSRQLHDRHVVEPRLASELSWNNKQAALQYLMFLKKQRRGTIRGCGCTNGRKQRLHTNKEDASSPTDAIKAVILACVIDAMERQDMATVNIPGAFMQAKMDDSCFVFVQPVECIDLYM